MKENVKIHVKTRDYETSMYVEKGTSLDEIVKKNRDKFKYDIIYASVDNASVGLDYQVMEPCNLSFFDMRETSTRLIYQRSLFLIFLLAINEIQGEDVTACVKHPLNGGIYTELIGDVKVNDQLTQEIERRMYEIVDKDYKIDTTAYSKNEIISDVDDCDLDIFNQKKFVAVANSGQLLSCSCNGFQSFFYGILVPSAGYIKVFQLVPYGEGYILRCPDESHPDSIPPYRDDNYLYESFKEAEQWARLMETPFIVNLNQKIKSGEWRELIQVSEALHEKKIAEIADMIVKKKKRLILIAGPSSSGKTTFARRLSIQLRVNGERALYMGTDDYFVEREFTPVDQYGKFDFENLNAVDVDLFNDNMNDLLAGKEVDLPVFDFIAGMKRYGTRITKITEDQPIIIEGIHALNPELTSHIPDSEKFKIYISPITPLNLNIHNRVPVTDIRLIRRIVRDARSRGATAKATIDHWPKVRTGENKNIFPYNGEADVLFNSATVYELAILKKYVKPLLKDISRDDKEFMEAQRLLNLLRYVTLIEDDSLIPNNSILREFIGGSIWVK